MCTRRERIIDMVFNKSIFTEKILQNHLVLHMINATTSIFLVISKPVNILLSYVNYV